MAITRDDYRIAMLDDATDEWQPLAAPVVRAEEYFPTLVEAERAELVAGILRELLTRSLIALAPMPDEGRSPRPLSPEGARAAIEADGWRHQPGDIEIGYMTTRPGKVVLVGVELCWACDGYVHRIATRSVEFEDEGGVGGTVPVCDNHRDQREWPEGAADWIAGDIIATVSDLGHPDASLN